MTDFTKAVRFSHNRGQIEWTTIVQFSQSPVLGNINQQKQYNRIIKKEQLHQKFLGIFPK